MALVCTCTSTCPFKPSFRSPRFDNEVGFIGCPCALGSLSSLRRHLSHRDWLELLASLPFEDLQDSLVSLDLVRIWVPRLARGNRFQISVCVCPISVPPLPHVLPPSPASAGCQA